MGPFEKGKAAVALAQDLKELTKVPTLIKGYLAKYKKLLTEINEAI